MTGKAWALALLACLVEDLGQLLAAGLGWALGLAASLAVLALSVVLDLCADLADMWRSAQPWQRLAALLAGLALAYAWRA